MARQTLYRAYRPSTFTDVIGQEHITIPLQEQIANNKVTHAYLFSGSRGLGKTSVARILAKEIGCSDNDIMEIDAASNNSVDDIRTLTENVYTLPFESEKKMYILDEAHMLSKAAWNAFLKTLEEPPAHAIFVLATTELEKVPDTVQSRCQVFEFKKPTRQHIEKLIEHIAKKERITLLDNVSDVFAIMAEGSYRDALSHFEKVLTSTGDKSISREEVEKITGAPKYALVRDCVEAVANNNLDKALSHVRTISEGAGKDEVYLAMLTEFVRNTLLFMHAPMVRASIREDIGQDVYADVEKIGKIENSALTHNFLRLLLEAAPRMRYQSVPAVVIELALIEHLS